ncbi:MAG: hypothetical protein LBT58_02965, partial [Endomicrobium sp.]|nr:hypothetical protein [Endomicrobium sp.]
AGLRVEKGKNYQDCSGRVGMKYKFGKRRGSGRDLKLAKKRIHRYVTERLESSKEKLIDMKMKLQAQSVN